MNSFRKISIIIPCFNEAATIHQILDKINNAELPDGLEKEIILIDDCSTDGTTQTLQNYIAGKSLKDYTLLSHSRNQSIRLDFSSQE
jgi:glycosyltransferase involved in cell wall biosynthesis